MEKKHLKLISYLSYATLIFVLVIFGYSLIKNVIKPEIQTSGSNDTTQVSFVISEPDIVVPNRESKTVQQVTNTAISRYENDNNARMKKLLEKLNTPGITVNIAAIGGSITEGEGSHNPEWGGGYAYRFRNKLEEKYSANINLINAGLCGTPSSVGCMRYTRDVVDKLPENGTLDMLIIEFAVNDSDEVTSQRGYEGIVYRALRDYPDCAVLLLFSVTKAMTTCEELLAPIGEYYGLPMVSMQAALATELISLDDYFDDYIHPSDNGHELMADCLMKKLTFDSSAAADVYSPVPDTPYKSWAFTDMTLVDSNTTNDLNVIINTGSFKGGADNAVQMIHSEDGTLFPSFSNGFIKVGGDENAPFSIQFKNCTKVIMSYKTSNGEEYGSADLYVNGRLFYTFEGYSPGIEGYNRTSLLVDAEEPGDYIITIEMNEKSAGKFFSIYSFAYSTATDKPAQAVTEDPTSEQPAGTDEQTGTEAGNNGDQQ